MATTRAHLVALDPPDDARAPAIDAGPAGPLPLPALELPQARRPSWSTLAALAAGCGVAAVALGAWALVATVRSEAAPSRDDGAAAALTVLTAARAERLPLRGSVGRITLVVDGGAGAVLALDGLGQAPAGKVYAAWLVPRGSATPVRVATFAGTQPAVLLERSVPRGARVGVTLERSPAPDRPSRPLRLVALRG